MIGPAFSCQTILGRRLPAPLKELLQRGFTIRLRNAFASFFNRLLEQNPLQQFPGGAEPGIQINRGNHGFEGVRKQRLLFAPAGLFFSPPQAKMLSKTQPARRRFERARVHDARAALGKLPLRPLRKSGKKIFACKQLKDRIAQKFQPFIIRRMHVFPSIRSGLAQLGYR